MNLLLPGLAERRCLEKLWFSSRVRSCRPCIQERADPSCLPVNLHVGYLQLNVLLFIPKVTYVQSHLLEHFSAASDHRAFHFHLAVNWSGMLSGLKLHWIIPFRETLSWSGFRQSQTVHFQNLGKALEGAVLKEKKQDLYQQEKPSWPLLGVEPLSPFFYLRDNVGLFLQ